MVVTEYNKKKHIELLGKTPSSYTLLQTDHLQKQELPRFTHALEMVNVLNVAVKRNEVMAGLGIDDHICLSHFSTALEHILMNRQMQKKELYNYFSAMGQLGEFQRGVSNLIDLEYYISFGVDFVLLGMPMQVYNSLSESMEIELDDKYDELYNDFGKKKIDLKTFVDKASDLVKSYIPVTKYDELRNYFKQETERQTRIEEKLDEIGRKLENNEKITEDDRELLDA